jgi:hypothetical protein
VGPARLTGFTMLFEFVECHLVFPRLDEYHRILGICGGALVA